MKLLKVINEFRPEHRAMYFGQREELKLEFSIDSKIVLDVIKEMNQKLNDDLETETMLLEDSNLDHNLYSFLRTEDILEEGMSFITSFKDGKAYRELIIDDNAKEILTKFRLVIKNVNGINAYCLTPLTLALQYQVLYYDYDFIKEYIEEMISVLVNHGFSEIVEF